MRGAQFLLLTKILNQIPVPDYIHAFERGRSIPSMAQTHVGKGIVLSLDLKNFFPSIKQNRLQEIFQHLGMGAAPARTVSELCTYDSFVPQGALTSPKVSNVVSSLTFGPVVKAYCDSREYAVSIYADDITISLPTDIVKDNGYDAVNSIIQDITTIVRSFGFTINREKTKVMRPFQRQYVCGVVVNQQTNLQQVERRRLRAMVHNCEKNGIIKEAEKTGADPSSFASQLQGRLNWFAQLNPVKGEELKQKFLDIARLQACPTEQTPPPQVVPELQLVTEAVQDRPAQPAEVPWVV